RLSKDEMPGTILSRRLKRCGYLSRRAADFHPIQINRKCGLGETIAVVTDRHFSREQPLLIGEGFARRAAPIGTIADSLFHLCFHQPFGLVDQLQYLLMLALLSHQHLDAADQLALHIHCHRALMAIKRFAGALTSMPHLRIVDTDESAYIRALLDLTTSHMYLVPL